MLWLLSRGWGLKNIWCRPLFFHHFQQFKEKQWPNLIRHFCSCYNHCPWARPWGPHMWQSQGPWLDSSKCSKTVEVACPKILPAQGWCKELKPFKPTNKCSCKELNPVRAGFSRRNSRKKSSVCVIAVRWMRVDNAWRAHSCPQFGVLKRIQTPHSLLTFILGFLSR